MLIQVFITRDLNQFSVIIRHNNNNNNNNNNNINDYNNNNNNNICVTCICTADERRYIMKSEHDQLPVGLIAQWVEHCNGIAEVISSNPV